MRGAADSVVGVAEAEVRGAADSVVAVVEVEVVFCEDRASFFRRHGP